MITEASHIKILEFIESLCELHESILHSGSEKRFFRSMEDFSGTEKTGNVVLFQPMPGGFGGDSADDAWQVFRFALWHLQSYERENDAENQLRIQAQFEIGREFMNRFYNQPREFDPDDEAVTSFFDMRIIEVTTDAIAPTVADGWLGYRFEYVLRFPALIEVNNTKWTDL